MGAAELSLDTVRPMKCRNALLVGSLAAGATVLVRRRTGAAPSVVGRETRAFRNARVVGLMARGSGRYAVTAARKTFADAERRQVLDREFQMKTAADVTQELGNMKGALMKIGQMASYLDTGLPDHVRDTLASLQSDAPPMSVELAAATIEAELGAPPDELFAEWDPDPIAAASIGQVHRAITHDNEAVAVKIQYPGVAKAVASDLSNVDWIFSALGTSFPGLESGPVVEEIKTRLHEELDYLIEAENQEHFATYFDGHPFIHVPKVHRQYSTQRVLTTDLATGVDFDTVMGWSPEERNLTAETLFRFSFGCIYRRNAFNGDPHPGNYLFRPGGHVTFLDFGLVKRFDDNETSVFQKMLQAKVIDRDVRAFRSVIVDAGLLEPGAPFSDEQVGEYFDYFYSYVAEDRPVTIDDGYAAAGISQLFDANGEHGALMKALNVPPSLVVLQRITLGLMGLFAQLSATANWRAIAEETWPMISAPPSTEIGRVIASYRQSRGENFGGV